ncbi:MAG: DUF1513 domain-containing protein [Roseibium sp.]
MRSTVTKATAFSRRSFLAALGGFAAVPVFSRSPLAENLFADSLSADTPLFASAFKAENGSFGIGILNDLGQVLAKISLPGRGHGIAISPDRSRFVAFARRPGTFAIVVRPFNSAEPEVLVSEPGRHFYGHGCFSADGQVLYAVENDFEAARGMIGVYDMSGLETRRIGEIETYGIGPHDILLSQDGETLIVANGGIETHPDKGREKLNLDTMAPSVVYLDRSSGDLLATHQLDGTLHRLSLRHMALDAKGCAWVGGQFQGDDAELPPLVAVMSRDEAPSFASLPENATAGLQNYIGSVTATADGTVIATSAPRGGKTLFWKADTGDYLGYQVIPDGCGVAPIDQGSFLISDGNGGLSYVSEPSEPAEILARPPGIAWDNHMVSLT